MAAKFLCLLGALFLSSTLLTASAQFIPPSENPRYDTRLNPKYNSTINPTYNSTINPKFNYSIHPQYNNAINPRFNSQVNPKYNTSLNPKFNIDLDPNYAFGRRTRRAAYLFDENGEALGMLTRPSDAVLNYFDTNGSWIGYFVRAGKNFNLFTPKGEWTGKFLSPDGQTGYNLFDEAGEWTGNFVR